jgi:hypothetical protein
MERSSQLQAPAILLPGERAHGTQWTEDCVPELIWLLSRREKTCLLAGIKSQFLFHPAHCLVTILTELAPLHMSDNNSVLKQEIMPKFTSHILHNYFVSCGSQ